MIAAGNVAHSAERADSCVRAVSGDEGDARRKRRPVEQLSMSGLNYSYLAFALA